MTIALIQLPIVDPAFSATCANVPLAAGYLASYLKTHPIDRFTERTHDIVIPPRELVDFGGDAAIIAWVLDNRFEVAGFTCCMWNVERSLRIAKKLKEHESALFVIAGGPEITGDCTWLTDSSVDTFVIGEGEEVFKEIIAALASGKKPDTIVRAKPVRDLGSIPNPYMSGILSFREREAAPFETTRGCPFGCTYCFYSKSRKAPRHFPEKSIREFFAYAAAHGASEIYVMDPSFNASAGLPEKLRTIREANTKGIPIHTEINLELVNKELAKLMKEAGFVSVEAGLQSVNTDALGAVMRYFHKEKFIRGAELLRERGIVLRTGIIIGLPRDTIESFSATCDFIVEHSLVSGVEIYLLSVLPGTVLRREAPRFGISCMDKPPYWVLESYSFRTPDFIRARDLVEERFGLELFHDVLPHFGNSGGYTGCIDMRDSEAVSSAISNPRMLSNNCTILADAITPCSDKLAQLAETIILHNPFTCIQLVVRSDERIQEAAFLRASDLFFRPDQYIERIHSFDDDNQGRFGTRVFQLTKNIGLLRALTDESSFVDPVLLYEKGSLDGIETFLTEAKPLIVIDPSLPEREYKELREIYAEYSEYLIASGSRIE